MLNGAQLREINKFITTATTLALVGAVIYSHRQDQKTARNRELTQQKMNRLDNLTNITDTAKFFNIIKEGYFE